MIKTYCVQVIREAGKNPVTKKHVESEEQLLTIDAIDARSAYVLSHILCTIKFTGQVRRTFIDGEEYFDEKK